MSKKRPIKKDQVAALQSILQDEYEHLGTTKGERAVLERLLKSPKGLENLARAFADLNRHQTQTILREIVTEASWPLRASEQRKAARELQELNQKIARSVRELQHLWDLRDSISETQSMDSHTDMHPIDWLERAADTMNLDGAANYRRWVWPELDRLRSEFRLKYWPRTADVIRAIGSLAEDAEVRPVGELTTAAVRNRQTSPRDFFEAITIRIRDLKRQQLIPKTFDLSNAAWADLASCVLSNALDEEQVKKLRQRIRIPRQSS